MSTFSPDEYWGKRKYKIFVVHLESGEGGKGKKRNFSVYIIMARTPERAVEVAKKHCYSVTGKVYGYARLATPRDLGATTYTATSTTSQNNIED